MLQILLVFLVASLAPPANPVFIKLGLKEFPPLTFSALRFLVAALILFPFWYQKKNFIRRKDLLKLLPYTLNMVFFAIGVQYSSVTMSGVLYALSPILTVIYARFIIKERFTKNHLFGLVFAVLGVSLLLEGSIQTQDVLSFGTPLGNGLILLAILFWGMYPVAGRILSKSYDAITITFYNTAATALVLLIASPFEWTVRSFNPATISSEAILSIFGTAVIGTALAHVCWQRLIKLTSAFTSSLVQYTGVVAAITYGALFFGEKLTTQLVIGSVLIILGVFLATTYSQLKKRA